MQKIILLSLILICTATVNAQQVQEGSLFRENQFISNPAMTGLSNWWEVNASYRQQWVGFNDAPRTLGVNGQFPVVGNNMSFGGMIGLDKVGPFQESKFALSYAYKIPVGIATNDRLIIGVMGSISEFQVRQDEVVASSMNDVFLPQETSSNITPNASAGIFYTTNGLDDFEETSFFVGVAANQLINADVAVYGDGVDGNLKRSIHGNATTGVRIINGDLAIEPSVWVNYAANNITNFNLGLRLEQYETFHAGLIYSSNQTLGLLTGMTVKNRFFKDGGLRVGLLGSYNIGKAGEYQGLSFEFVVGYRFVNLY